MATALNAYGQAAGTLTSPSGFTYAVSFPGSGMTNLNGRAGECGSTMRTGRGDAADFWQTYATVWNNGGGDRGGGRRFLCDGDQQFGQRVAGMGLTTAKGSAFVSQNGTVWTSGRSPVDRGRPLTASTTKDRPAGYGMTASGTFRAFIWTPGEGYMALGTLGGANSYAMAINDSGMAAGSSQVSSGYVHAFVSNGNSMQDLGYARLQFELRVRN